MTLKLAAWGGCLGLALGASVAARPPDGAPGPVAHVAFYSATAAAYLAVFTHCLMRLAYSRWPSWFLYTAGFAGLSFSGILGLTVSAGLVREELHRDGLELLRSALLPAAAALMLSAAHASRSRPRGHRAGNWKAYTAALLFAVAAFTAWRSGCGSLISEAVRSTKIEPRLAICITSTAALLSLLHCTHRLSRSSHDEIVPPLSYWSVAMVLASVLSLMMWRRPEMLWWQTSGLELAGVAALVVGLSLENERAHREATEQMADLDAMQRVSWSLVGASDISELTSALARAVSEGFHADPVAVYLVGSTDEELVVAATSGMEDESVPVGKVCSLRPEHRPGFHNGHTARAFASGSIQIVSEVFSDVEFLPWRTVAREDGVVISVPLPYQGRVIGVVNLFLAGVTSVGQNRIRLLEAIAAAVSPAIENACLRSAQVREMNQAA